MNYQKPTIDDIVARLQAPPAGDPLVLTRFCDGEWLCMNGRPGGNCDGAPFSPALGRALRAAWWYFLSEQGRGRRNIMPHIHNSTFRSFTSNPIHSMDPWNWRESTVYDSSWTEPAVESGEICKLLRALRSNSILVGPALLAPVAELAGWGYVECHNETAFDQLDYLCDWIGALCQSDNVILCCGLAAEPLAMRLNMCFPWRAILDLGAILDPIGGRCSRGYQRKLKPDQIEKMKEALNAEHHARPERT